MKKGSTLKYTKMGHWLRADSTPEETLLWLQDLKLVINNQRTSMADGKIATSSHIICEVLWPITEAEFAKDANEAEELKSQGYAAVVN